MTDELTVRLYVIGVCLGIPIGLIIGAAMWWSP